jgi:hypothetical protein
MIHHRFDPMLDESMERERPNSERELVVDTYSITAIESGHPKSC